MWVTSYANDVMAYIPTFRVLQEGGYEGQSSMAVYESARRSLEGKRGRTCHSSCQSTGERNRQRMSDSSARQSATGNALA